MSNFESYDFLVKLTALRNVPRLLIHFSVGNKHRWIINIVDLVLK